MYCAQCLEESQEAPCQRCGQDPLLDGRYRLQKLLGRGAQGTTWAATRTADGLLVAIKAVPLPPGLPAKERELASREVEILRQLRHPSVPSLLDSLTIRGGAGVRVQYLVQQFIPGRTLAEELSEHRLSEDDVLGILEGVLPALQYLHDLSPPVIHRDLKPRNVMRRPDGELVLIDFGSVKDAMSDPQLGGSTVAGTFGYMAPEQLMGEATAQSDLYALGATAVALLSRKEPREMLVGGKLVWQSEVNASRGTVTLLEELLAIDPEDRPASARVVLERVRALRQRSKPQDSALPSPAPTDPPRTTDRRWAAVVGGAGVLLLSFLCLLARTPAAPQCGLEPCLPVARFEIRGLQLGQRYEEATEHFPELLAGEMQPTELVYDLLSAANPAGILAAERMPGSAYHLKTLIADTPADCHLAFAVRETLSQIRCTIRDGDTPQAKHIAEIIGQRHGPATHESKLGSEAWLWDDATGHIDLRREGAYQPELRLVVQTAEHGLAAHEVLTRARSAAAGAAAEKEAQRQREIEALQRGTGSSGGL